MSRGRLFRTLSLVMGLLAAHAYADRRLEKWNRLLTEIDQSLKDQRFDRARNEAIRVTRWMLEGIGGGPDAMYTLGVASSFRALAEAGLRNEREAEWYWHTAVSLYPPFARSNLTVYGAAGEMIMHIDRGQRPESEAAPVSAASHITRPQLVRRVEVDYPRGALEKGIAQPIRVEVLIGTDGIPRRPRIIDTGWEPSLAFAALEALKSWRFSPAMADGRPIQCSFVVTMTFKIKH